MHYLDIPDWFSKPEVDHLTDWTSGTWWIWWIVAAVAMILLYGGLFVGFMVSEYDDRSPLWAILGGVVSLVSLGFLTFLPGNMFRHSESWGQVWWIALAFFVYALVIAFFATAKTEGPARWFGWVPAIAIAGGLLFGIIGEAFTRAAAAVGVGVGFLVVLLVVGVIFGIAKAMER